jgi:hypothetical protein
MDAMSNQALQELLDNDFYAVILNMIDAWNYSHLEEEVNQTK